MIYIVSESVQFREGPKVTMAVTLVISAAIGLGCICLILYGFHAIRVGTEVW